MASYAPILVAEDEETDGLLLRVALKRAGLPYPMVVARDGQEAVDYLCGAPPFSDRLLHPLPGLLLLDLKMPRLSGFDVLAWLATRPDLKLPVIILSSSPNQADIEKARQMGAHDCLTKPHDYRKFIEMLQQVAQRWLPNPPHKAAPPETATEFPP